MQDKDSIRSSINKRMNVVHRCIRTPNIVLRALSVDEVPGSWIKKHKRQVPCRSLRPRQSHISRVRFTVRPSVNTKASCGWISGVSYIL